ncbi:MAG: hypothetical protein KAJ07_10065 [Planctomycetes bacterium]|nr:hypothetical protein [Planctomycetota bacterium]
MKKSILSLAVLTCAMMMTGCATQVTSDLRCEYMNNPLGIDNSMPQLSWKLQSTQRAQPKAGIATYKVAHKEFTHADFPVVVLINSTSASASEILAGVLQDRKYKRAVLVGERSYGKGTVQGITDRCGNDSQLKYTMAHYHLPSGNKVESRDIMERSGRTDWGVSPDVSVQIQSPELKPNESAITIERDNFSDMTDQTPVQQVIDSDSQLAIGLLVLKSKIIQSGLEI